MTAAPFRMAITPVLAALLLSTAASFASPVVKFVPRAEKTSDSQPVKVAPVKSADLSSRRLTEVRDVEPSRERSAEATRMPARPIAKVLPTPEKQPASENRVPAVAKPVAEKQVATKPVAHKPVTNNPVVKRPRRKSLLQLLSPARPQAKPPVKPTAAPAKQLALRLAEPKMETVDGSVVSTDSQTAIKPITTRPSPVRLALPASRHLVNRRQVARTEQEEIVAIEPARTAAIEPSEPAVTEQSETTSEPAEQPSLSAFIKTDFRPVNHEPQPAARLDISILIKKVVVQPKATSAAEPVSTPNVLREKAVEALEPLRTQEPNPDPTPDNPAPSQVNARDKAAEDPGRSIAKVRIQHVAAPRAVVSSDVPAVKVTPRSIAIGSKAGADSVPPASGTSRLELASASGPAPASESVNSELVQSIVGQPSLIAFVATEPDALGRAETASHISTSRSADDFDEFDDGLTGINRVTVNVRPTEGELPPDHASAKFARQGEVVQRMGASRHWMMYEFNWEASGLATRPLYFEDVNLERYGYSHGLILGPVVSAGHFFLRVPFIPYMRGASPPLKPVYTLGYGRPGSYFPYHLHRPPISLRGAVQEAAWAVGLIYILP